MTRTQAAIVLHLTALLLAALVLPGSLAAAEPDVASSSASAVTVYLVRHAEKAEGENPGLTPAGEARARGLVSLLASAGVTHLHSTDFRRTRDTLAPLAKATGLTIEIYDPNDLQGFAARLAATPGVHVVVGHSNTTPDLVEALGGIPISPIDESDYGRLYVVFIQPGVATGSVLLHLPAPALPAETVTPPARPKK